MEINAEEGIPLVEFIANIEDVLNLEKELSKLADKVTGKAMRYAAHAGRKKLINLGLFFPIVVIPLAVVFVSNAVNLLGGFDGLQPGMALIAGIGFLVYSIAFGSYMGTLLSTLFVAAVFTFLPFNAVNPRIIPGDTFTYATGAIFVAIMVMGNAEAVGIIIFIPWIIEFFLHLRRKFKVTDLGIRQPDGSMKAPYGRKIYSLTHVVMNLKKATERDVTVYLCAFEAAFVILALLLKVFGVL